jgi:Fic family protein
MDKIRLEKPSLKTEAKKKAGQKFFELPSEIQRKYFFDLIHPKYLFWDKVKYRTPPEGLSSLEYWTAAREMRRVFSQDTFLKQENGKPFSFLSPPDSERWHNRIDTAIGGGIFAPYSLLSEQNKQKFLSHGLIEEAIASSQLEGANTSRKAAKKMILEKKEPVNRGERMIINNYKAMQLIEEELKNKELSQDLLLQLHRIVAEKDPEIPTEDRGRFRIDADEVKVVDGSRQEIAHVAPAESFLQKELLRLIDFANDKEAASFTHPLIKAIFLHFWIGYLHPFTDGNGRIARALFYWYLLRKNYWAISYIPISMIIKKSPSQYGMAYIYTEQDEGDLTYFYDYHIRKIIQALEEFDRYVKRKIIENKEIDKKVNREADLNDRQKQLLHYLLSENDTVFTTMGTHSAIYNVSRVTAHKDLLRLEKLGYIFSRKVGRQRQYYLGDKLR